MNAINCPRCDSGNITFRERPTLDFPIRRAQEDGTLVFDRTPVSDDAPAGLHCRSCGHEWPLPDPAVNPVDFR